MFFTILHKFITPFSCPVATLTCGTGSQAPPSIGSCPEAGFQLNLAEARCRGLARLFAEAAPAPSAPCGVMNLAFARWRSVAEGAGSDLSHERLSAPSAALRSAGGAGRRAPWRGELQGTAARLRRHVGLGGGGGTPESSRPVPQRPS